MKKVAYCLYGVPRLLQEGSDQILKFVENQNNCEFDFYCQAWWDSNEVGTENKANAWVADGFKNRLGIVKSDTDKKIIDLYNPIKLQIEPFRNFDETVNFIKHSYIGQFLSNPHNCSDPNKKKAQAKRNWCQNKLNTIPSFTSQYCARKICVDLLIPNILNYDCIIFSRYDFINEVKIKINDLDLNKVYCSSYSHQSFFKNSVEDNFMIFHPSKLFFQNVFDNLENLSNEKLWSDMLSNYHSQVEYSPEYMLSLNYYYHFKNLDDIVKSDTIPYFHGNIPKPYEFK
jgi:hypothetical protein